MAARHRFRKFIKDLKCWRSRSPSPTTQQNPMAASPMGVTAAHEASFADQEQPIADPSVPNEAATFAPAPTSPIPTPDIHCGGGAAHEAPLPDQEQPVVNPNPNPSFEATTVAPALSPPVQSPVEEAKHALDSAGRLGGRTANAIDHVGTAWEATASTAKAWNDVVSKIDTFSRIVDAIGNVHPYVGAATSVIKGIALPIVNQNARDDAFEGLVKEMARTYHHVETELPPGIARPTNPDYATRLLLDIVKTSEDCARFIRDEYITKNFWKRALSNTIVGGEIDDRIQEFKTLFVDLRESWRDANSSYITSLQTLNTLIHISNAGYMPQKSCLANTRVAVLHEISEWFNDPNGASALYLVGVAGSGKSSIAHSIAGMHRLGSFFTFNRADTNITPERVLGTIAHDLAMLDERYRNALVRILKNNDGLYQSRDIRMQWKRLIIEPSSTLSTDVPTVPLLIVIDAFDESGVLGDSSRQLLLDVLTKESHQLPRHLKLLVTSRAEPDITTATESYYRLSLDDISAVADIHTYVRHRLPSLEKDGLDDSDSSALADAADGLFQWAATACAFLEQHRGSNMRKKFEVYREQLTCRHVADGKQPTSLDVLYATVLGDTFEVTFEAAMANFRIAVALAICPGPPLSIDTLQAYYSAVEDRTDLTRIKNVLSVMGVVLQGTTTPTSPVRPMHKSFVDFLTDQTRSGPWHVSLENLKRAQYIRRLGPSSVANPRPTDGQLRGKATLSSVLSDSLYTPTWTPGARKGVRMRGGNGPSGPPTAQQAEPKA